MHRDDNSKYLLFIEPKKEEKLNTPINDELTEVMELALSKAKKGVSRYSDKDNDGIVWKYRGKDLPPFGTSGRYMGVHMTDCGESSECYDLLLENGMITNTLAAFYLRWYRYSIPENDMKKVKELLKFYKA